MERDEFYHHLKKINPYLQTPKNVPCQEKTNVNIWGSGMHKADGLGIMGLYLGCN